MVPIDDRGKGELMKNKEGRGLRERRWKTAEHEKREREEMGKREKS